MTIANVIGWKFNNQSGMRCAEVGGAIRIIEFPGGIPTQAEQDQWTAEYEAWLSAQQTAATAEAARLSAIEQDPVCVDLRDRLAAATPTQISNYVDANVTDLASARALFKRILLVLALLARSL
jgi:hypothetical protein